MVSLVAASLVLAACTASTGPQGPEGPRWVQRAQLDLSALNATACTLGSSCSVTRPLAWCANQ